MKSFSGRLAAVVGLLLTAGLATAVPAQAGGHPGPGEPGFVPGPTYAGNTWKWGDPQWRDEWEPDTLVRPLEKFWRIRGTAQVRWQHGMMTFNSTTHGSTTATLMRRGHKKGRWEMRLRTRRYANPVDANYTVQAVLIPRKNRLRHCGGQDIVMHSSVIQGSTASFAIHTLPNLSFTASRTLDMSNNAWHTYAVEVTRKRISWFVDSQVVVSERRPAALSHTKFTVQYRMLADGDKLMNRERLQMDWLRYWNLKRPNQKSVKAPEAHQTTYAGAC